MDSNAPENADSKAQFRKPSNDAANRKYRRRSPVGGSSSPDDSVHGRSSSPVPSRQESADERWKKDESGDLDGDYRRSGRSGESHRHSDRQSSRSYNRYDDHSRRDGRSDDYGRNYGKSTCHSSRDSRGHSNLDYSREDKEYRSRDCSDDVDKHHRERSDAYGHRSRNKDTFDSRRQDDMEDRARDKIRVRNREDRGDQNEKTYHRSFGDRKSKYSSAPDESRGPRDELSSRRESSGNRQKEASSRESKGFDSEMLTSEEKRRHDDRGRFKEQPNRDAEEQADDTKIISSTDQDSISKKPKLFSLDSAGLGTNGASEQAGVKDSDIDAAKIAAMKAAELVNKNLVGTGYMSADQKKKLLWGSKKTTTTEESAHHWDTSTFGDRERQEKFNKLMGVKGEAKVEHKADNPDMEKQREQLQLELEKQYTAGLRRRDGRTVGLGL